MSRITVKSFANAESNDGSVWLTRIMWLSLAIVLICPLAAGVFLYLDFESEMTSIVPGPTTKKDLVEVAEPPPPPLLSKEQNASPPQISVGLALIVWEEWDQVPLELQWYQRSWLTVVEYIDKRAQAEQMRVDLVENQFKSHGNNLAAVEADEREAWQALIAKDPKPSDLIRRLQSQPYRWWDNQNTILKKFRGRLLGYEFGKVFMEIPDHLCVAYDINSFGLADKRDIRKFGVSKAPDEKSIIDPLWNFSWDDDLVTALEKLQRFDPTAEVFVKYCPLYLGQVLHLREQVNRLTIDIEVGREGGAETALRRISHEEKPRMFGDPLLKKAVLCGADPNQEFASLMIQMIARPVKFRGNPYQIRLSFLSNGGFALYFPNRSLAQAKQMFGPDADCYVPFFLAEMNLELIEDQMSPREIEEAMADLQAYCLQLYPLATRESLDLPSGKPFDRWSSGPAGLSQGNKMILAQAPNIRSLSFPEEYIPGLQVGRASGVNMSGISCRAGLQHFLETVFAYLSRKARGGVY